MKITVFGAGYVGLVQAAALAEVGHDVLCVDIDARKIENLRLGVMPVFEPGLDVLVRHNQESGRLRFTTDPWEGVAHACILFIAVGTPPEQDGSADVHDVLDVAQTIAERMSDFKVLVDKSTVPVGTVDKVRAAVREVLAARGLNLKFEVVSNPEFLKEGAAVHDCMRPDRIIIGTSDSEAEDLLREVYAPFNRNRDKIIVMDARSAELTKYAANCMLAARISFMNEIADLAELVGADIEKVRLGIGADPRIGHHFIYPGIGYGGSCFPKDVRALTRIAERAGFEPHLLRAVESVNEKQKQKLFHVVDRYFGSDLSGKTFAIWGLSFKPNTDDMREAPSRALMARLWSAGAKLQVYDPKAMDEARRIYGLRDDLHLADSKEAALKGADALIICTEWQAFRAPDFALIKSELKQPVIFDGRNLFEPERMRKYGFVYYGIGRGESVRHFGP